MSFTPKELGVVDPIKANTYLFTAEHDLTVSC